MRQGLRRIMIMAATWLAIPLCTVVTALPPAGLAAPVPDIAGGFQPLLRPFLSQLPEGLYSTAPYTLSTLNRINYHRAWAGAAPIALQSQISAAAQAHAVYLNFHQNASHEESSGLAGYTGQWAWDRMKYQGYNYSAAGEVISFGKDAQGGVDALITAIYHRFALLDPGYTETGIGDAPHAVYQLCQVINLGRPSGVAAATQAVSIYPADGQTEVPISFDSDSESPDPMPTLGVVGYPVSIQFSTEQSVTLGTFTLAKEGQTPVATTLLSPTTDSNIQQSGKKNFSLIPNSPLQADTLYQATFTATVQGQAYTASWSFTTVPPATLAVTPNPATFAMGQVGELTIIDGSGGYQVGWSPSGKFTVAWSGDGTAMLITPVATGTATITLTDTQTQAKVQIPVTIVNGPVSALTGSRALSTGWNLLALPLTPANPSVNTVLGGILNQVVSAWKWTGSTWAVLIPANDDEGAQYAAEKGYTLLQTINAGEGFWINAASPVTFTYSGSAPADATIPLTQGWNLVGLKTLKTTSVGEVSYPSGTNSGSLWTWTGSTWEVALPQENDGGAAYAVSNGYTLLQTISPGQGYWVHVSDPEISPATPPVPWGEVTTSSSTSTTSTKPPTTTTTTSTITQPTTTSTTTTNTTTTTTQPTYTSTTSTSTTTTSTKPPTTSTTSTTAPPLTTTSTTTTSTTTTSTIPVVDQPNSSIRIYLANGDKQDYYSISDIVKLKVIYRDPDGVYEEQMSSGVNWISADPQMAEVGTGSVAKAGTVTFKNNGDVGIYAFLNGLTDHIDFKVGSGTAAKHYGNLVILAGGEPDDSLQSTIQYLCNRIYQTFKYRMFKDEDIYYINNQTDQDMNGDGVADNIVDQPVKSVDTLHQALLLAAKEKNDGPLYLYLMDHGAKNGSLQISSGQILTAAQLDAFLDEFEASAPTRQSVVIIEACNSGSFVNTLAGPNRMIVTSSSKEQLTYFLGGGALSFGQFFSNYLMDGETWEDAFDKAVAELAQNNILATMSPQKSIGAAVVMGKVYSDLSIGGLFPKIKSDGYTKGTTFAAGAIQKFDVQLDVMDAQGIEVWAMVTPPNFQPPTVGEDFTTPVLNLDSIIFTGAPGSTDYNGSYTFPCGGSYVITYYAKDSNGMVASSPPQTFTVSGTACVFTTQLLPSWNLLSLPVIPTNSSVDKVLAGVKDSLVSVWKWENGTWSVYLPDEVTPGAYAESKGFGNLETINPGEGFWVNSTNDGQLTIAGTPPSVALTFISGWNLVGLKNGLALAVTKIAEANPTIISVWKWENGAWAVYLPDEASPGAYAESKDFGVLNTINPGEGFWVNKQ